MLLLLHLSIAWYSVGVVDGDGEELVNAFDGARQQVVVSTLILSHELRRTRRRHCEQKKRINSQTETNKSRLALSKNDEKNSLVIFRYLSIIGLSLTGDILSGDGREVYPILNYDFTKDSNGLQQSYI